MERCFAYTLSLNLVLDNKLYLLSTQVFSGARGGGLQRPNEAKGAMRGEMEKRGKN